MKSIRFLKICLLACLCFGFPVYAQQILLDRPILERVTVDPVTGDITIDWSLDINAPPISPYAIEKFILFWYETKPSTTNHPFDSIPNPAARSYTFNYDAMALKHPNMPDPRKTSVPFSVGAVNRTLGISSLRSYEDYNIQVNSKYDSCKAEIRLNWHPYKGWLENTPPNKPLLSYYVIRISNNGGVNEEVKKLSDKDTFYIVPHINENEKYTFFIRAQRSDGMISESYKTTKETKMPIQPTYIVADGSHYNSDGLAEISFKIDPAAQTYSYEFWGSGKPDYAFVSLGAFNIHGDTVLTDIQAREKTYYYKLEAWHVCKNKTTATSNMATALWLTLKQTDQVNLLQWDSYIDWGGDAIHELHRQIGSEPEEIISSANYSDDLSGIEISGDVCYWVTARPVSPTSSGQFAISNTVCIKPESDIYIPQAFIPNSIGLNAEWKPFFSYPPQDYMLFLYDRTGAKIFETKNPDDGWNGQFANGKPASEGVYMYYLKFRTAMGRLIEKRGTISLILP